MNAITTATSLLIYVILVCSRVILSVDPIASLDNTRISLTLTLIVPCVGSSSYKVHNLLVQSQKSEMIRSSVCVDNDGRVLESAAHYKKDKQHYFAYSICY